MKKHLIIFISFLLVPTIARSTVGDRIYINGVMYSITKDVVVNGTNSYTWGEVMIGMKNGWGNGGVSGNVTLTNTIKYNNYTYTVAQLGKWAFRDNSIMTSITTPSNIKDIEEEAFLNCISLEKVTITPGNWNSISDRAFKGCISLESVEFDGTSLNIGPSSFADCINLQSFPFEKVPRIRASAFSGCKSLTSIILNAENIEANAFENCTSLTSVTFAADQVNIGSNAFNGCKKLRSVTSYMDADHFTSLSSDNCFSGINPNVILYVPNGLKSIYENDASWHAAFPKIRAIAPSLGETFSADIPVGNGTMRLSFEVTNAEKMEVKITSSECEITTPIDLTLPTEISYQDWDFTIAGISPMAFANIQNIHSLTVGWRQPFGADDNFDNVLNDAVLYVPAGTKKRYEVIETWQNFSQIIEASPLSVGDISTLVGSNVSLPVVLNNTDIIKGVQFKLTLPQGVSVEGEGGNLNASLTDRTAGMTIMGHKDPDSENSYLFLLFSLNGSPITGSEGVILNVNLNIDSNAPFGKKDMIIEDVHMTTPTFSTLFPDDAISELLINTNVRNIDFADNGIKKLCTTNWDLNDDGELDTNEAASVNSLADVFAGNVKLTSFDELQYFTGLSTIREQDFSGCTGLTSVVIPCNVTSIEGNSFLGCNELSSIFVDDKNTVYDSRDNCNAIIETSTNKLIFGCKSSFIPNSVTSIGECAFSHCSGLTSLNIPKNVTSIGEGAFNYCYDLSSITIDEDNDNYDSRNNCNAIIETETNTLLWGCENTTIPNSITAIGKDAFREIAGITKLIIPAQVTSIGENAFQGCNYLTIVKLKNTTPVDINANVFSTRSVATLYVPIESIDDYNNSDSWNDFKVIKGHPDGDVNQNGETDVADVIDIVRFVLNTPSYGFDEYIADMNLDDIVNVADAVTLVNYLLGDVNFESRQYGTFVYDDVLQLTKKDERGLSLTLEGNGRYTAFQFDLILPNGIDVSNMTLSNQRKQKHQLLYHKIADEKYRVVALSTSNNEFLGTEGELLNIMIDGHIGDDIMIDNIHFVTVLGHDILFTPVHLNDNTSTGIISTREDNGSNLHHLYNLHGQRIDVPQKGINILDGKKVIIK